MSASARILIKFNASGNASGNKTEKCKEEPGIAVKIDECQTAYLAPFGKRLRNVYTYHSMRWSRMHTSTHPCLQSFAQQK